MIEQLDTYPHAALAVIENAGHALIRERPELLGALITEWLSGSGDSGDAPAPD